MDITYSRCGSLTFILWLLTRRKKPGIYVYAFSLSIFSLAFVQILLSFRARIIARFWIYSGLFFASLIIFYHYLCIYSHCIILFILNFTFMPSAFSFLITINRKCQRFNKIWVIARNRLFYLYRKWKCVARSTILNQMHRWDVNKWSVARPRLFIFFNLRMMMSAQRV